MKRLLAIVLLCAAPAFAEREVFAPTKLAPTTTAAGGVMTFSGTGPYWTGANISSTNSMGIGPTTASVLTLHTNNVERIRINSAGDVFVGNGQTNASPIEGPLRATGASGTDIAGANMLIAGGQGTGTGAGGVVRFSTAAAGSTGSSLNSLTERMRVKQGGQVRFVPLAAAPTLNVEAGDVYYDTGTNKLRVWNGTAWQDLH